jgi:hypothetical protein
MEIPVEEGLARPASAIMAAGHGGAEPRGGRAQREEQSHEGN